MVMMVIVDTLNEKRTRMRTLYACLPVRIRLLACYAQASTETGVQGRVGGDLYGLTPCSVALNS